MPKFSIGNRVEIQDVDSEYFTEQLILLGLEDEPYWHYRRVCMWCNNVWDSLHCPHDYIQNPCPTCGRISIPREDDCECEFDC